MLPCSRPPGAPSVCCNRDQLATQGYEAPAIRATCRFQLGTDNESQVASMVLGSALPIRCLSLAKSWSIRLRSGAVGRAARGPCAVARAPESEDHKSLARDTQAAAFT